uniref:Transposase n=1 Tax=Steinernema glaseri TaxID=37863 RepID=A0A1I7YZU5_9BILA
MDSFGEFFAESGIRAATDGLQLITMRIGVCAIDKSHRWKPKTMAIGSDDTVLGFHIRTLAPRIRTIAL